MLWDKTSERHYARGFFFYLLLLRAESHRITPRTRWTFRLLFLSTEWPWYGFTLLLCVMKPLSLRFRLGLLRQIWRAHYFPFSVSLWVSRFLSHLFSVRRFGCDGGSDSLPFCLLVLVSLVVFVSVFFFFGPFHTALANARP